VIFFISSPSIRFVLRERPRPVVMATGVKASATGVILRRATRLVNLPVLLNGLFGG
jgi:hypothetical protein